MNSKIKKTITFLAAGFIALTIMGSSVYAKASSDEIFSEDSSGNVFGAGDAVSASAFVGAEVKNELFEAGMNVSADNVSVDGSAFMAGNNLSVLGSKIGGSIFAAGQNITIDSIVKNNIWLAGNTIAIGENTSVKGLHVAGASISVSGEYEGVSISGEDVTFNGKATGDVYIEAENVIIGKDAVIDGELKVESSNQAQISDGASVAEYTFIEVKKDEDSESTLEKATGKAAIGYRIFHKVKNIILNAIKFALLAVIFTFVFKKNMSDSYEYATKKIGAFWGFGTLTLITFPIVAVLLCVTVIGIPVAGLLATIYVLALCFARVFAFASFIRELIFSHTGKRLHPIAEAVIAVLPAAVIKEIPIVGGLTGFACAIYTIGYIVLAIAFTIRDNKTDKKTVNNIIEKSSEV